MTTKEEILETLRSMPDDAGIDEAIDRLHLLMKVQRGLEQAESGLLIPHDQARERVARWLE